MDKVKAMQCFVRIVEANSFTKAAETLNLPRAALTATMQRLEAFLGTVLLQRTTRRLALTPDGLQYYQQCLEILGAIDAAELSLRAPEARHPRGKLRVDLPSTLGLHLVVTRLAEFRAAYPDVTLALGMTDRLVDLTQEGVDCALRVGRLPDSSLVAKRIGTMRFVTCAAPAYLARHGTPRTIAELSQHEGVVHFSGRTGRPFAWDLQDGERIHTLDISGPVAVSAADANTACALQGLGLAQAARYQVREHLAQGRLVELLPATPPTAMPVSLVYPKARIAAPKLAAFVAWVAALAAADPDLCL